MKKNFLIVLLSVSLVSVIVSNFMDKKEAHDIPFDAEKWKVGHAGGTIANGIAPFREKMIFFLIRDYKINTLNKEQILNLLGKPDQEIDNENTIVYWLDWRPKNLSVDTLWQKELHIKFDKNSKTVSNFEVVQWWDTIY